MKFGTILSVGAVVIAGTLFAASAAYGATLYDDFDSYPTGHWREGTTHGNWFVSYDSNTCGRVGMLGVSGV